MKPRVQFLITCLEGGGAQRVVHDLALGLSAAGWRVRVTALRQPSEGSDRFTEPLLEAGISVGNAGFRHPLDLVALGRLLADVWSFGPDLLHAHLFHAHLAARLCPVRRVVCSHHEVERRNRPLRPLLQRLTGWRDAATVAVSQAVADHVGSAFGFRARVIPNGLSLARLHPPSRLKARLRLGLDPQAEVIGAVGRLHPQKGLEDLLQAFAELRRPGALLLLAGEGGLEEPLRRLAERLGVASRVRFLGFQKDVSLLLPALDVLAMPSRWEGFGLGLVEAMACGVPVVATRVDSLPEVAGGAARLVRPARPDLLAKALGHLLDHPEERAELSRLGRARARAFRVEAMVQAHLELYWQLLR